MSPPSKREFDIDAYLKFLGSGIRGRQTLAINNKQSEAEGWSAGEGQSLSQYLNSLSSQPRNVAKRKKRSYIKYQNNKKKKKKKQRKEREPLGLVKSRDIKSPKP
ncbi:hypothetical protein TESG_08382 [Trichophyton tonsurans CBS 112818]|uniref:Uncharacterized protein n=1 Tax=Trichophyton tonsurans (strain CBS 112818) TaxID=647933 RepID=F2RVR8_TRIT1|nr:hypothetical protein TESG_08382 [Trichophyton tonsurans CBS 112818]